MENNKAIEQMSIFERLMLARAEFLEKGIQKSGKNNYAEFKYFELSDIVPLATELFTKYRLLFIVSYLNNRPSGILFNVDNPQQTIIVDFEMNHIAEPSKLRMNEVQATGAELTYARRYLYMLIFDIVSSDEIDSLPQQPKQQPQATPTERKEIKKTLTAPEDGATELQIKGLKESLKKLVILDESTMAYVDNIVMETGSFKKLTKLKAEELIKEVGDKIASYGTVKDTTKQ